MLQNAIKYAAWYIVVFMLIFGINCLLGTTDKFFPPNYHILVLYDAFSTEAVWTCNVNLRTPMCRKCRILKKQKPKGQDSVVVLQF